MVSGILGKASKDSIVRGVIGEQKAHEDGDPESAENPSNGCEEDVPQATWYSYPRGGESGQTERLGDVSTSASSRNAVLRRQLVEAEDSAAKDRHEDLNSYLEFQLRRFDFLIWHPSSLALRLFVREHPLARIFLRKTGHESIEGSLVVSCYLAGSFAITALFYNTTGESSPAQAPAPRDANETWWERNGTTTTTTTAPPAQDIPSDVTKQVVAAVCSLVFANVPAFLLHRLFYKPVEYKIVSQEQKLKTIRRWRRWQRIGFARPLFTSRSATSTCGSSRPIWRRTCSATSQCRPLSPSHGRCC